VTAAGDSSSNLSHSRYTSDCSYSAHEPHRTGLHQLVARLYGEDEDATAVRELLNKAVHQALPLHMRLLELLLYGLTYLVCLLTMLLWSLMMMFWWAVGALWRSLVRGLGACWQLLSE
jgi:hypothetical protein